MISETIKIDVYDFRLFVIVCRKDQDTEEELKKELNKLNLPDDFISDAMEGFNEGGWGGQYIFDGSTRTACIEIHNCDKTWKIAGVLTHEMDHIRYFIVKKYGLKGTEASAYLAEFLSKKLFPLVLRMK